MPLTEDASVKGGAEQSDAVRRYGLSPGYDRLISCVL